MGLVITTISLPIYSRTYENDSSTHSYKSFNSKLSFLCRYYYRSYKTVATRQNFVSLPHPKMSNGTPFYTALSECIKSYIKGSKCCAGKTVREEVTSDIWVWWGDTFLTCHDSSVRSIAISGKRGTN